MRSDSQERRMAMIAHDQPYWAACARVAGMDEAGRGRWRATWWRRV